MSSPFERVTRAMGGVDDTIRDTIVYPDGSSVLGLTECEDQLVLTYASKHDDAEHPQMIWINLAALLTLTEAGMRILTRKGLDPLLERTEFGR